MDAPTAEQLLRGLFLPLAGLPCWQVRQGYGSFISMEFGAPRLAIREPVVVDKGRNKGKLVHRREVTVRGSHHLWVEQCGWKIMEGLRAVTDSDAPRDDIARALALIDGQVLCELRLSPQAGTCLLGFEHRVMLGLSRHQDWKPADPMLSLSTPDIVLTIRADGRLEYGREDEPRRASVRGSEVRLALKPLR